MPFITTLNKIREHHPCETGWKILLQSLNKTKADDEPLNLLQVLDSNGFNDCLWCFEAVDGKEREMRLFAVWCARYALNACGMQADERILSLVERYANWEATAEELASVRPSWTAPGVGMYSDLLRVDTANSMLGSVYEAEELYAEYKGSLARDAARCADTATYSGVYITTFRQAAKEIRAVFTNALREMLSKED